MKIKKVSYLIAIFFYLINIANLALADESMNLEKLEDLKNKNLLTTEDYEFFKAELSKKNNEIDYYNFSINSKLVSRRFKILSNENKKYIPLKEFFDYIGFVNFEENKRELIVYLGSSLQKREINLKKSTITNDGVLYLDIDVFKKIFLSLCDFDEKRMSLSVQLSFGTPKEIERLLSARQEKLKIEDANSKNEIIFSSTRKLFDLGYMRVQLGQNFNRDINTKRYKTDWNGSLNYQGGLLYGELGINYDARKNEFGEISLKYTDIWKEHNFDIISRPVGHSRAMSLNFYKNKSFYDMGGEIVIRQSVPIGSRVELIYLGQPIDIQNEVDGSVVFKNPAIRTDQTYTLKIYTPDGKITEKEIKTVRDYNHQKKNEIQYNLSLDEDKSYDRFRTNAGIFYGVTDKFTVGVGYARTPESIRNKVEYIDELSTNLVYSGTNNGLSYTFNLGGVTALNGGLKNDVIIDGSQKSVSLLDRYSYNYLMQLNYSAFQIIYKYEGFGKYFDTNNIHTIETKYTMKYLDLGYTWSRKTFQNGKTEENENSTGTINAHANYSWKSILLDGGIDYNLKNPKDTMYTMGIYYNGWEKITARIEGAVNHDGTERTAKLSLYNNNFGGLFDFSGDIEYSNKTKARVTFSVAMKFADWFTFNNTFTDTGEATHSFGIDKIIDLQNPTKNVDSTDSSRVKVVTFLDANNNDKYDEGEEPVSGVTVSIADQTIDTNKDGEALFYGLGNGIIYDIKTIIKKPALTIGNKQLKVKSNFSSTVDAYIPIKPMLMLSGIVEVDEKLNIKPSEMEEFYSNLIIEIRDFEGKVIDSTVPDNEGIFEMSGLFPDNYYIEVTYVGTKHNLQSIKKEIELYYSSIDSKNTLTLKVGNRFAIELPDRRVAKRVAKAGGK